MRLKSDLHVYAKFNVQIYPAADDKVVEELFSVNCWYLGFLRTLYMCISLLSSPYPHFRKLSGCLKFLRWDLTSVLFLAAAAKHVILGLYGQPIRQTAHVFEQHRRILSLGPFLPLISSADIIAE